MSFPPYWIMFATGLLFGVGSGLLLILNGRIAGFSSMIGGVLMPERETFWWKSLFVLGAIVAGATTARFVPGAIPVDGYTGPIAVILIGGFLVGIGTRVGNGCTSGHGVCGMGRMSKRSIVATLTFTATGIVTVTAARLITGGV